MMMMMLMLTRKRTIRINNNSSILCLTSNDVEARLKNRGVSRCHQKKKGLKLIDP
jgi:hypothetical protein